MTSEPVSLLVPMLFVIDEYENILHACHLVLAVDLNPYIPLPLGRYQKLWMREFHKCWIACAQKELALLVVHVPVPNLQVVTQRHHCVKS